MRYLLDTHIWIWAVSRPNQLSTEIKEILEDGSNEFFISSISIWEFLLLVERGRVVISKTAVEWIEDADALFKGIRNFDGGLRTLFYVDITRF